jgi:hypothetical protein
MFQAVIGDKKKPPNIKKVTEPGFKIHLNPQRYVGKHISGHNVIFLRILC